MINKLKVFGWVLMICGLFIINLAISSKSDPVTSNELLNGMYGVIGGLFGFVFMCGGAVALMNPFESRR